MLEMYQGKKKVCFWCHKPFESGQVIAVDKKGGLVFCYSDTRGGCLIMYSFFKRGKVILGTPMMFGEKL